MKKQFISMETVAHIAWLARVELSEEEKALFTKQFNEILEYFRKLDELNTEQVSPTYHVLDLVNIFRKDEVKPSLSKEESTRNAPRKEEAYFKAPKII